MNGSYNEISILNSKIDKCSSLYHPLNKSFFIKKYFDYDLFGCHKFLEVFFETLSDRIIEVNYLNIDFCRVVKKISLDIDLLLKNPNALLKVKTDHMSLHGGSVEGSYYLSGDKASWFIFYDAQCDTGVLMTNSEVIVASMADYLYSP
jgi:hypothetical protein